MDKDRRPRRVSESRYRAAPSFSAALSSVEQLDSLLYDFDKIYVLGISHADNRLADLRRKAERHRRSPVLTSAIATIDLGKSLLLSALALSGRIISGRGASPRRRGAHIVPKDARAIFEAWCGERDLEPVNPTAFGKAMTRLGYKRSKVGGAMRYEGVALRGVKTALVAGK